MVLSFSVYFSSYTLIFIHHTRSNYPNVHHVSRTYFDDYHDIIIIDIDAYRSSLLILAYRLQSTDSNYYFRQNTFRATHTLAEWYVGVHEDTHRKTFLNSFFFSNFS